MSFFFADAPTKHSNFEWLVLALRSSTNEEALGVLSTLPGWSLVLVYLRLSVVGCLTDIPPYACPGCRVWTSIAMSLVNGININCPVTWGGSRALKCEIWLNCSIGHNGRVYNHTWNSVWVAEVSRALDKLFLHNGFVGGEGCVSRTRKRPALKVRDSYHIAGPRNWPFRANRWIMYNTSQSMLICLINIPLWRRSRGSLCIGDSGARLRKCQHQPQSLSPLCWELRAPSLCSPIIYNHWNFKKIGNGKIR